MSDKPNHDRNRQEDLLNQAARGVIIENLYDPNFSTIEQRIAIETKLFLARLAALCEIPNPFTGRREGQQTYNPMGATQQKVRGEEMSRTIHTQKQEFDTLRTLLKQFENLPPIMDDGYPEARHSYELAMRLFVDAIRANGRINTRLTFGTFRLANSTRAKRWFQNASVQRWSIADGFMALVGELGEAANALKKIRRANLGMVNTNTEPGRQVDNLEQVKGKIAEEFAGVLLYLDQLAEDLGIDLEQALIHTYNKKSVELDFPERIIEGEFIPNYRGKTP